MDRRQFLSVAGAGLATVVGTKSFAGDDNPPRLVFIHGRSQQGLDPEALKATWLDTLKQGAAKANRTLPPRLEVSFPFYGDKLDDFAREFEIPLTTDIQTKGRAVDNDFLNFQAEVAEQMRNKAGISDAQVQEQFGTNPTEKGPQNWAWVQAIIRAIDRNAGSVSQSFLEKFMRDVYLYTSQAGVQDAIDNLVAAKLNESPCVIVGHSLGTVVAYHILR